MVQDATGAIELLLPVGESAPPVGTRLLAEGRVGVAYGAPRFRADRLDRLDGGRAPQPMVLHGQPTVAHEWRLVTVTGRIDAIHKLGDRWRAELTVGSRQVPILGQPGSGIDSASLVKGRIATVVGIVRRPFPTATDRRFEILPRSATDLRIEGRGVVHRQAAGTGGADPVGLAQPAAAGGPIASLGLADVDLIDLEASIGRVVRVGGLVVDLRPDGVTLDDGTTAGRVVLRGGALDLLPLLEPDDAINVVGRVAQLEDGLAVVVDDPGAISQAGDPAALGPSLGDPVAGTSAGPSDPAPAPTVAGLAGSSSWLNAGTVGVATLGLVSALSLAMTLLRRRYLRRRLAERIAERLAALSAPAGPSPATRSVERGGSTIHSA